MTAALVILFVVAWAGMAMAMETIPWFRTQSLHRRLTPYRPDVTGLGLPQPHFLESLFDRFADQAAGALGARKGLGRRLLRAGLSTDPSTYRSQRFTASLLATLSAAAISLALTPGWVIGIASTLSAGLAIVVCDEARLVFLANGRAQQVNGELPIVAEQLGMLLSAGFSLPAALQRLSKRGNGIVAEGLGEVVRRIRQGESELSALSEWADLSDVEGARRLVRVLTLHRQAGDLGLLISDEARSIRDEHHRTLLESISRRGQLVWIPVTVATLVPGLVVLAVPFASAVGQITGT